MRVPLAPLLSVVLRTRDRVGMLGEALAPLLTTPFPRAEIVVVDDGSTDGTRGFLAGLDDPRLVVVRHETARGHGGALNAGVAAARGAFCAFVDDDDVPYPDWLARLEQAIVDHDGPDAIFGDVLMVDDATGRATPWTTLDYDRARMLRSLVLTANLFPFPSSAFRRELLVELGGFREDVRVAEDYDLWIRVLARPGVRVVKASGGPLVRYRVHAGATTHAASEAARRRHAADVERVLSDRWEAVPLRVLAPVVDWDDAPADVARRLALELVADAFAARGMARLAEHVRRLAGPAPAPPAEARRRRVLVVAAGVGLSSDGLAVPRLLARALAARGDDVLLLAGTAGVPVAHGTPVETYDGQLRLVEVGVPSDGEPGALAIASAAMAQALEAALGRFAPDIVHVSAGGPVRADLLGAVAARGVPALYAPAGAGDAADAGRSAARAARVVAPSAAARDALVAAGCPPALVATLRPTTPLVDRLAPTPRPALPAPLVAGVFGDIEEGGVHDLLARALQDVGGVEVHAHGRVEPDDVERLRALDPAGRLQLDGSHARSERPARLAELDVALVLAAADAPCPVAVEECLAAGVPVVAAAGAPAAELLADDANGLVLPALDARAVADALVRLRDEPGLLARLRAGAARLRPFAAYLDAVDGLHAQALAGELDPGPLVAAPRDRAADAPEGARGATVAAWPAWRGEDALGELLAAWAAAFAPDEDVALLLVGDPAADGDEDARVAVVLAAAAARDIDLEACADVVVAACAADEAGALLRRIDAFVPTGAASAGLAALAHACGARVVAPLGVAALRGALAG